MKKNFFTTFEVAKICQVSPSSVIRWIREGKLPSSVTAGGHHRVSAAHLEMFLKKLRMPWPGETSGFPSSRILIVAESSRKMVSLSRLLQCSVSSGEIEIVEDLFAAGWKMASRRPDLVILNVQKEKECGDWVSLLHVQNIQNIPVLFLIPKPLASNAGILKIISRCDFLVKPYPEKELLERVQALLNRPASRWQMTGT